MKRINHSSKSGKPPKCYKPSFLNLPREWIYYFLSNGLVVVQFYFLVKNRLNKVKKKVSYAKFMMQ